MSADNPRLCGQRSMRAKASRPPRHERLPAGHRGEYEEKRGESQGRFVSGYDVEHASIHQMSLPMLDFELSVSLFNRLIE